MKMKTLYSKQLIVSNFDLFSSFLEPLIIQNTLVYSNWY